MMKNLYNGPNHFHISLSSNKIPIARRDVAIDHWANTPARLLPSTSDRHIPMINDPTSSIPLETRRMMADGII